ncbi:MAG: gliding motility-associated C-terminal domain-containing protein [Flavobacteriaceae bacterium]|nr:gliding motility-associated C-terminal domain-containing protein [Flavobacteriaceae bacterium]
MKKQITFFQNQLNLLAKRNKRILPFALLLFFTTVSFSQVTIDCAAGPVNTTYCYVDNDLTQMVFTNTDGFPLNVFINAGQVEDGFDELIVLDTDGVTDLNAATPYGAGGNLAGINYQSTGDTITIWIQSDGVVSCATNAFTPLDFDVWCQSCLNPTVSFATNGDCTNGNDFSINVDISNMGSATELLINDDQGSPPQSVTTTGVVSFGPYTSTTDVVITVNDANDVNCTVTSGIISCLSGGPGSLFINAGEDVVLNCGSGATCTDITASFLETFESFTENYTVDPITYDPPFAFNGLANSVNTNIDDAWNEPNNLPFDFCFFENIETQFQVGSNGGIRFEVDAGDTSNGWSFDEDLPNNTNTTLSEVNVFTPVHDIDPSVNGTNEIAWEILGTFPNRVLVVSYFNVPYFSGACNDLLATHMAVFYEFSNVIEIYIQDKPVCTTWNDGNAVLGIQNNAGTIAYVPPGRNTSDGPWTTNDEAWSISPVGAPTYVFEWLDADGNFISNDPTINVCPAGTEIYTAQITYTNCNGDVVVLTDEVTVSLEAAFTVDLGGDQEFCDETSYDITAAITGGNPDDATYLWNTGEDTQTITVTTSGDYTVEVTIEGCTVTQTVSVSFGESPVIDLGEDFQTCFFDIVTLDASPSNIDPTIVTYTWSLNGTEIVGEISPILIVTETGTYSVIVTNGNCTAEDSIIVDPSDDLGVNLGEDFVTCLNKPEPSRIYAYPDSENSNEATYQWWLDRLEGNGFELLDYTTGSIPVIELGVYRVEVTIGICIDTDEITVSERGLTAHIGPDIITCPDQSQTLTATSGGFGELTYKWFFDDVEIIGETSDTLNLPLGNEEEVSEGTYMVEISTGICSQTAELDVTYYNENGCVITQGVSPNGDGYNDNMDLRFLADRSGIANFQVFNRLGLLVYNKSNYRRNWGGQTNDDKKLPVGTYYYVIDFQNSDPVYGSQTTGWVYINQNEN